MTRLHLLGWAIGSLALLGVILGLRNPSWILFWLPSRRRIKSMAFACCMCVGLLGVFLAVSDMTPEHQPEAMPAAAEPAQMFTEPKADDAGSLAENADKITQEPASSKKNPAVSTAKRTPKPLAAKPAESALPLSQEQERVQEAIITRNRCRTAGGYLMAQSHELLMQAESLRRAGNQAALQDMVSRGTARRLPQGIEVPLWDQDLERRLVKFLIPGEEVLYWTRLEAVECNI